MPPVHEDSLPPLPAFYRWYRSHGALCWLLRHCKMDEDGNYYWFTLATITDELLEEASDPVEAMEDLVANVVGKRNYHLLIAHTPRTYEKGGT